MRSRPSLAQRDSRPLRPEAKLRRRLPAPQHAWPAADRPCVFAGVHRCRWRLSLSSSLGRSRAGRERLLSLHAFQAEPLGPDRSRGFMTCVACPAWCTPNVSEPSWMRLRVRLSRCAPGDPGTTIACMSEQPGMNGNREYLARKRSRVNEPHVQPLTALIEQWRHGGRRVPYADPDLGSTRRPP
jgi:hypothetical protein